MVRQRGRDLQRRRAGGCLADDYTATSIANSDAPGIGDGCWYLVREVTSAGPASYTSGGVGEQPGRDAEIVASGSDCP